MSLDKEITKINLQLAEIDISIPEALTNVRGKILSEYSRKILFIIDTASPEQFELFNMFRNEIIELVEKTCKKEVMFSLTYCNNQGDCGDGCSGCRFYPEHKCPDDFNCSDSELVRTRSA